MPHRLHIQIIRGDGRALDLTPYATRCRWEHGRTGPRSLTLSAPLVLAEALDLWDVRGRPADVVVSRGPARRWRGRLGTPSLTSDGDGTTVTLRAEGYVAALTDTRHTALWSDSRFDRWRVGETEEDIQWTPAAYEIETDRRVYITPREGEVVGITGTQKNAIALYDAPHRGSRQIVALNFDYVAAVSANWTYGVGRYNVNPDTGVATYLGDAWNASGGAVGSQSLTFAGCDRITLYLRYTLANTVYGNPTGSEVLRLTRVRVRTTTAPVTAGLVATSLLGEVAAINGDQLSTSTSQIVDPGLDLTDVRYEDARPLDVLQELASRGDGAGTVYEVGVDMDRRLFFRPRGSSGRRWFVTLAGLDVERVLSETASRAYAVFEDAAGETRRTALAVNPGSLERIGIARDGVAEADTVSATQAGLLRDAALGDAARSGIRANLDVARIEDDAGGWDPGDAPLPGDTVVIRTIGRGRGTTSDQVRTYVLGETAFDAATGQPTLSPEDPLPTLDVLREQRPRPLEV